MKLLDKCCVVDCDSASTILGYVLSGPAKSHITLCDDHRDRLRLKCARCRTEQWWTRYEIVQEGFKCVNCQYNDYLGTKDFNIITVGLGLNSYFRSEGL